MGKKDNNKDNNKGRIGVVYSTDPDFRYDYEEEEEAVEAPANQQKLRVFIDRKQRGGKEVTLITGFSGPQSALDDLAKFLKTKCGVGGSAKEGEIIIQGDHRDKIVQLLVDKGYTQTKKAGG